MTFKEWWTNDCPAYLLLLCPRAVQDKIAYMEAIERVWTAGQRATASTLAQFERMADARGHLDGGMHAATIDRVMRGEAPNNVDELIQMMNTRGGVCHLEHANMIREFFNRVITERKSS